MEKEKMNTETIILTQNIDIDFDKVQVPNLNSNELDCIETYVEVTRHIQEIQQLFHVFRCNLKLMLDHYIFNANDMIIRKETFLIEEDDNIIINALTINFLSSAKTLVESLENFLKLHNNVLYDEFKKGCLSKIYDDNFYYRFLIRMRDFSQHGHLPVDVDGCGKCCFNLTHILSVPHFSHNKKLSMEMKKIKSEIYDKYSDVPNIIFTVAIAEFNLCVLLIYKEFLNKVENILLAENEKLNKLLNNRPDIIYNSTDFFNGYIFYKENSGGIHCFSPQDNSLNMFVNIKEEAFQIFIEEEKELEELKKAIKMK